MQKHRWGCLKTRDPSANALVEVSTNFEGLSNATFNKIANDCLSPHLAPAEHLASATLMYRAPPASFMRLLGACMTALVACSAPGLSHPLLNAPPLSLKGIRVTVSCLAHLYPALYQVSAALGPAPHTLMRACLVLAPSVPPLTLPSELDTAWSCLHSIAGQNGELQWAS